MLYLRAIRSICQLVDTTIPFELATGSQLQIDNIAGYALDFYNCEIVEKTRPFSYYYETL